MSVNHSARSGGVIDIYFRFPITLRNVVCPHKNRLIKVILMRTHNISFSIYIKNENHLKLS